MRPILLPTYQSDAYAGKVENKRDVTKSKTVTREDYKNYPTLSKQVPFSRNWHAQGYLPAAGEPGQEGLQPALLTLAVGIHEDEHVPGSPCGSQHPTADDSKPLVAPDELHTIQLRDVFTQS